jgi:hypothetical protein
MVEEIFDVKEAGFGGLPLFFFIGGSFPTMGNVVED